MNVCVINIKNMKLNFFFILCYTTFLISYFSFCILFLITGVCHAEELQYLFPISQGLFVSAVPTENCVKIRKAITKMWVNFAYYGWVHTYIAFIFLRTLYHVYDCRDFLIIEDICRHIFLNIAKIFSFCITTLFPLKI